MKAFITPQGGMVIRHGLNVVASHNGMRIVKSFHAYYLYVGDKCYNLGDCTTLFVPLLPGTVRFNTAMAEALASGRLARMYAL